MFLVTGRDSGILPLLLLPDLLSDVRIGFINLIFNKKKRYV